MADACKAQDLLRQTEAENKTFSQEVKRLHQRVSNLTVFERAVLNRVTTTNAEPEVPQVPRKDQDLHKEFDLFTHYKFCCPSRRNMSKFDRSLHGGHACRACHDSSSMLDLETWQPVDHGATLQRFPPLVKKEIKDLQMIERGSAGPSRIRGKPSKVSKTSDRSYKTERHNIDDEIFSSPVRRPRAVRGCSVRSKGVRRRTVIPDSPSSDRMSTSKESREEHGSQQNGKTGKGQDEGTDGNQTNGYGADDSIGQASRSRSLEDDGSYRESSSPVKAWYMRPERMESTLE